jgi:four helix bundle protein
VDGIDRQNLAANGRLWNFGLENTGGRIQETGEKGMKSAPARNFQDLLVWQKAHQFVLDIYRLTENFPRQELFGLTSQLRRAAVSIPANIAEGFKKRGQFDKARFMNIAQGSLEECRYYLILAQDLKYAETAKFKDQLDEVGKLLASYCSAILANAK